MKEIPLTKGLVAIVDDEDYEWLSTYKWHALISTTTYARTGRRKNERLMHRLLMPEAEMVDHVNMNGLDNRRCNLRACTKAQNRVNSRANRTNKLGIKGVHYAPNRSPSRPYVAQIMHNRKKLYIGSFATVQAAERAYRAKAKELFGEFSG